MGSRRVSSAHFAAAQAARRERDAWSSATAGELARDRNLADNLKSDEKVAGRRRQREEASEARAQAAEAETRARARRAAVQTTLDEQEALVQAELERRRHADFRAEKERQRLRAGSEELQQLEQKLKTAWLNKERHVQTQEAAALAEAARERERAEQAALDAHQRTLDARRQDQAYERELQKKRQLEDIERQVREKEEQRAAERIQFAKDKVVVEEIVQQVHAEESRAAAEHSRALAARRAELGKYLAEREEHKKQEQLRLKEEEHKILQYQGAKYEREQKWREQQAGREAEKLRIYERMANEMLTAAQRREEYETLKIELAYAEEEERLQQDHLKELERRERERVELREHHLRAKEEAQGRAHSAKEEEEKYRLYLLEEQEKKDRLDRIAYRKELLRRQTHKGEVERMMNERREQQLLEFQKELADREEATRLDEEKRKMVLEERKRMLKEHVEALGSPDFLPSQFRHEWDALVAAGEV